MKQQFTYKEFSFSCSELKLKTKKTWQTSHSSSQQRTNFLVTITHTNKTGRGEAGLPPKKPGCYLADTADCFHFFELFEKKLILEDIAVDDNILDVRDYFMIFRNHEAREIFYPIFSALHSFKQSIFRAAISAIEFALLDLWASILGKPLLECVYGEIKQLPFKSFLAVSIGQKQIQNAKQATELTPFIKLKFKNDFTIISQTLSYLIQNNIGQMISVDANASWSVQTTTKVIEFIAEKKYQYKIYCLEQPYDVYPTEEWKDVFKLAQKNNIRIMSDESFANGDDVSLVKQFSNAVNIKIEKAGGLIESIKSLLVAKEAGMELWLGMMISSWLGCTQTFMLAPLAQHGDLDAGYIVVSPFEPGFKSDPKGYVRAVEGVGLAVEERKSE